MAEYGAELWRACVFVVALLTAVAPTHALAREFQATVQTRVGAIDLNRTNVALLGSFVPAMNVLAMPFLFRSTEHPQTVLHGPDRPQPPRGVTRL